MKKWKLGKLAVATGIAAMALAFSGVIEPAGAGNIPQKVVAATQLESKTFTVDSEKFTYTGTGKITITDYEGRENEINLPEILKKAINNGTLSSDTTIVGIDKNGNENAFQNITTLYEITLPSTLTIIGEDAFENCSNLNKVNWESGNATACTTIGENAFRNCAMLSGFTIPASVTSIGVTAFEGCSALTSIILPDGLNNMGEGAFKDSGLTEVNIPAALTSIPKNAFWNTKLSKITIPKTVTEIGKYAFYTKNSTLKYVDFEVGANPTITSYSFDNDSLSAREHVFICEPTATNAINFVNAKNNGKAYAKMPYLYQRHTKSLSISKKPTMVDYYYNNPSDFGETWKDGIELSAVYTYNDEGSENTENKETKIVNTTSDGNTVLSNCKVSGYSATSPGPQTITINYGGNNTKATYDITLFYRLSDTASETNVTAALNNTARANTTFTGGEIKPTVTLTNNITKGVVTGNAFTDNDNYRIEYDKNINAGENTATVTIEGNESKWYKGTITKTFTIYQADLSSDSIKNQLQKNMDFGDQDITYNSLPQKPVPTLSLDNKYELVSGSDYSEDITYKDNINASENATLTLTAKDLSGNFTGSVDLTFEIKQKDLKDVTVKDIVDQEFTGGEIEPEVELSFSPGTGKDDVLLTLETDYTVEYSNNKNVTEEVIDSQDGDVSEDADGSEGADSTNEPAYATATIKAVENSNYTGTVTKTFKITPATLTADMISISDKTYNGEDITLSIDDIKVTIKNDDNNYVVDKENYEIVADSLEDNKNAGTAKVKLQGKGNLKGDAVEATFTILPMSLENARISTIDTQKADGTEQEPEVTVTVKVNGEDVTVPADAYDVAYSDNINAGTATVTVTAKKDENGDYSGNYCDSVSTTFVMKGLSFDSVGSGDENVTFDISLDAGKAVYNGTEINPVVTVKKISKVVKQQEDESDDNQNEDENTPSDPEENSGDENTPSDPVENSGDENAPAENSGDESTSTEPADDDSVQEEKIVSGEAPADNTDDEYVEITLEENKDYTVKLDRKAVNAGVYTVTVSGVGIYEGERKLSYTIVAKDMSKATLAAISEQKWTGRAITPDVNVTLDGKVLIEDVDFETTYSNNVNEGTANVTVTGMGNYTGTVKGSFTIKKAAEPAPVITEAPATTEAPDVDDPEDVEAPSKTKIKKLTNIASKKLVVSWKKLSDADGYEVSIATKKNFKKGKKVKNTSKVSYTFTKLKKRTTYYVRVRAYNIDNGTKVYGKYSAIKKIKIKK